MSRRIPSGYAVSRIRRWETVPDGTGDPSFDDGATAGRDGQDLRRPEVEFQGNCRTDRWRELFGGDFNGD